VCCAVWNPGASLTVSAVPLCRRTRPCTRRRYRTCRAVCGRASSSRSPRACPAAARSPPLAVLTPLFVSSASAKQVQTLQEELRLAESRGAEMNRQVETLQVQLEARDRSLAVKEQQLQESSAMHKAMSVEGQPPPPPWGWPPGMAAMPPQTQQHQGPGTPRDHHDGPHPVFHPLFPGAAQASRMAVDGGPGGGAAPPFFAPSGPMMGPPGPGAFGHHPHHPHAMWHSPPPGSAPPQPVPPVFGDFGNNQQGGASGPEAALGMQPLGWPPQHHMPPPPLHSVVGPPPLVLQPPTPPAVSPEAAPVGERRTVVRTPMPPSSSSSTLPTDNGHAARNGDVPAPASFGETQATPQPSTGKRGGGGSRRRGGGGNAAAQAPPPSPQLMF